MATLILTTVGGAIGGPIGAALGAVLGQSVDRGLLAASKTVQGPRLTELAVQTSSYGWPIPRLFGTMRVAGSVIWSTDLLESSSTTSAGKGAPKTTSYSYRASFAVLLSARPILGVARIWADGNLLRGAAGDFKTACGFRLHLGGETQDADPLIVAAEGAALAPAHRGCAYAVFEDLQLADFGNRIPSLTFELTADPAPVPIGAIAADVTHDAVDGSATVVPLAGFSAYGDSQRAVLEALAAASGAWFAVDGGTVRMQASAAAPATIADAGVAAKPAGRRRVRTIAAVDAAPRAITLAYYDPARDYQAGVQRARRPGAGTREDRIDLPAALAASDARTLAEAALARAGTARETRTVALDATQLALPPGGCVTLDGDAGSWRIARWSLEAMVLTLELERIAAAPVAVAASSGRVLGAPDAAAGRTRVVAVELPALGDALLTSPRLLIAAAGTQPGWRRASLLVSTDDGARWTSAGSTAAPATLGSLLTTPGAAPAATVDRVHRFEVLLVHPAMTLADADADGIDQGANLALVGDELLQFGRAEPLGGGRWALSQLVRGRRGTEPAIGTQAVGDRFVVLDASTLVALDLPVATIGATVRVLASGIGDGDGPAEAAALLTGVSVRPPAPAHLAAQTQPSGALALSWVRRSRIGWRWIDGVDAPLGEEREAYRVTVAGAAGTRTIDCDTPTATLDAAALGAGPVTVTVRQVGTNGESWPATITVPASGETR